MPVYYLSEENIFPSPHLAEETGLLAVGADLSHDRLLLAYRLGIFPWFSDKEPVLWWSPDPRLVLFPHELKVSKSLKKVIRKKMFHITADTAFDRVIKACAGIRAKNNEETWIGKEMIEAYLRLYESGFAHSVEAWHNGKLAGGLYGVSLGKSFFGESMFTRIGNASKVAFVALVDFLHKMSFDMIDCQITSEHLVRFGAREIPRSVFLQKLEKSVDAPTLRGRWDFGNGCQEQL